MNAEPTTLTIDDLLEHESWLRRVVIDLVHEDEVDDILQDTWIAAMAARRVLHPRAWLKRVAHNLALGKRRGAARRRAREEAAAREESLPSTDAIVERIHAHRALAEAVTELAEPYRTAVLLRYFEQLPPREIAKRLGVTPSTVRTHIDRGLAQVRAKLDHEDFRGFALLILAPRGGERLAPHTPLDTVAQGATSVLFRHEFAAIAVLLVALPLAAVLYLSTETDATVEPRDGIATAPRTAPSSAAVPTDPITDEGPDRLAVAAPADRGADAVILRGIVRDVFGAPVAGVPLKFRATPIEYASPVLGGVEPVYDGAATALGASNALGRFAAPCSAPNGQIHAGGDFITVRFFVPKLGARADEEAVVIVARRGSVRGRVVDELGVGLGGVAILPQLAGLLHYTEPVEHTSVLGMPREWTSSDGSFEIDDLPIVDTLDLVASKTGFSSVNRSKPFGHDLTIVLREATDTRRYHVRGRVVDHAGRPAPGALVVLDREVATADGEGRFEIFSERLTERSALGAGVPGSLPAVHTDAIPRLMADGRLDDFTMQLGATPASISGRIVDTDGAPIAGAVICLLDATVVDEWTTIEDFVAGREGSVDTIDGVLMKADARSRGDGSFALAGLGFRDYRVRVFDPATLASRTTTLRAGTADVDIEVDVAARRTFTGRLRLRSGEPVDGARVQWSLTTYDDGTKRLVAPGEHVMTDAEGRFTIDGVPAGDAHLSISGRGILDLDHDLAGIASGTDLEIQPWALCRLRAVVASPDAERIRVLDASGADLELKRTLGQLSISSTNGWSLRDGRTQILEVSESAAWLIVMNEHRSIAQYAITLDPDGVTELRF